MVRDYPFAFRLSSFARLRGRPGGVLARTRTTRRPTRIQSVRPQMARAYRLFRAASRLGVPGAVPAPPELIPAGARVLAQGYLNRFSMPLLGGWLLPPWMHEQSDPACEWFVPRSVANIMVNQTRRNWTALGIPGHDHPVESLVDRWGLLTPVPGGSSLDWWVDVEGAPGRMVASRQGVVLQTLQAGLPVVATSYEANGLRVSSEAWLLPLLEADWAAMQVVLFNIADLPLRGTFSFATRPYNPEGIAPVYNIAFDGTTLVSDGRPGPFVWPEPDGWALSSLRQGDLFGKEPRAQAQRTLFDPNGFAHGTLQFAFNIEPWEEAEFLAFVPVHTRTHTRARIRSRSFRPTRPLFNIPTQSLSPVTATPETINPQSATPGGHPNPQFYSRAKAATTIEWRDLLDSGMKVEVPHHDLQASWEANRAHLLALHDGDSITPGPDLYHSFWFRDAAYMTYALSACGYAEAAVQLLRAFARRQRRDGAFISHLGEWDSTGQMLWCMGVHLAMHPDANLLLEFRPVMERGARWIADTLAKSPGGLMPPGVSSEHFGPTDRYYWDDIWALAGLRAAHQMLKREHVYERAAVRLRRTIARSWATDMAHTGREALVAAPGRDLDLGMIGTLAAWFPLRLVPTDSPLLEGTLAALEENMFYRGALFVNTGHSGWGSYLNMRIAGCRLLQGSPEGWRLMQWLLRQASPTYNWPEGIHTRSGGGSAGDGQHGWASAEWLLLVRALLFREDSDTLVLTPNLPEEWLQRAGQISIEDAPTRFGPLTCTVEWEDEGRALSLQMHPHWRKAPRSLVWRVPGDATAGSVEGKEAIVSTGGIVLPTGARSARVERG